MKKEIENFLSKISNSKPLAQQFQKISSSEELENFIIQNSDGGFNRKEFEEALIECMNLVNSTQKNEIITDDDLKNISGGAKTVGKLRAVATLSGPIVDMLKDSYDIGSGIYDIGSGIYEFFKEDPEYQDLLDEKDNLEEKLKELGIDVK